MGIPKPGVPAAKGAPNIAPAGGLTSVGLPAAPAADAAAALPFELAAAALLEPEAAGADADRDDAAGDRCLLALGLPLAVAPGEVLEVDAATADDGDVEDGADVARRDVILAVACLKVDAVVAAVAAVLAFRMERLALPPVAVIVVAVLVASLAGTKTASRRSKVPSTSVLGMPLVLLGIVRDTGG
jgi:hypothetical protein